jgi:quercetin dioxygenase-like cupin family protein
MTAQSPSRAHDALAALGADRLRPLAARLGAADARDATALAASVIAAVADADELRHHGLSDADVETIGIALGLGTRAAWRPRVSAEEFERLPFYDKPSYDGDVWAALAAAWGGGGARPALHPRVDGPIDLATTFVHLGLGATVVPQEPFTGMDWYERYGARTAGDGLEGRLVSMHTFDKPWDSWEMHPSGHELVLCVAGTITLHQEQSDKSVRTTTLVAGQAAINAPGIWHTADVTSSATAVFITAGTGTQHRPR